MSRKFMYSLAALGGALLLGLQLSASKPSGAHTLAANEPAAQPSAAGKRPAPMESRSEWAAKQTPMPGPAERAAELLRAQPFADATRARLLSLAQTQRAAFAARADTGEQTRAEREERSAQRAEFRREVRDVLAAMTPAERAAMRKHRLHVMSLARLIESEGGAQ